MSGEKPEVGAAVANSPGVSGLVLAIQAPRVGLGVGVFGASSVAYSDIVNVVTMTNAAALSTGIMLTPPCKRTTYTPYGHVGIDAGAGAHQRRAQHLRAKPHRGLPGTEDSRSP